MKNKKLVLAIVIAVTVLACIGAAVALYLAIETGVIPNPHGALPAVNGLVLGNAMP